MIKFIEVKANANSISHRKLVLGVATNDADYITQPTVNGKQGICPYYRRWKNMLKRCYSDKYQAKYQTYIGTTICGEWLTFSVFKAWMEARTWQGLELDKDIIKPGNKHYSADACCFVPKELNLLLNDCGAVRGEYPQGVSFHKQTNKYQANCRYSGKQNYLGCFKTPREASLAYRHYKANLIAEIAFEQADDRIERGLMLHAALILKGDNH